MAALDALEIYDAGPNADDRYTVLLPGEGGALGLNANPDHPQHGISQWSEVVRGAHLGRRIAFADLPPAVRAHLQRRLER